MTTLLRDIGSTGVNTQEIHDYLELFKAGYYPRITTFRWASVNDLGVDFGIDPETGLPYPTPDFDLDTFAESLDTGALNPPAGYVDTPGRAIAADEPFVAIDEEAPTWFPLQNPTQYHEPEQLEYCEYIFHSIIDGLRVLRPGLGKLLVYNLNFPDSVDWPDNHAVAIGIAQVIDGILPSALWPNTIDLNQMLFVMNNRLNDAKACRSIFGNPGFYVAPVVWRIKNGGGIISFSENETLLEALIDHTSPDGITNGLVMFSTTGTSGPSFNDEDTEYINQMVSAIGIATLMSRTNAAELNYLNHLFTNANWANIGDATGLRSSTVAGSLYISLHTASPGEGGNQTTNEATFGAYDRIAVARSGAEWLVATDGGGLTTVRNQNPIQWLEATSGNETITHVGIGTADFPAAGNLLWYGQLNDPRQVATGVTVSFPVGQLVLQADLD